MSLITEGYRRPARWLHWITAVLVLLMIPAGLIMVQQGLPRRFRTRCSSFTRIPA